MSDFKIFFRTQVVNYVLFLVGRVGSTYLTSLMNSHPNIEAFGEEIRDLEKDGAKAQLDWTNKFMNPPMIGKHGARGFNVKLVHIVDPDGFRQLLQQHNCKIMHMQRRNRVKAVISRINGKRLYNSTGMWGLYDENNRLPPLKVDLEQFDEYLQHREKVDNELADYVNSLSLPTLQLCYEDLTTNQGVFLNDVFQFLGVDPMPVKGETLKITSDNLREAIENFDELRSRYAGTQYEAMFDEVLVS
jgi:LPS sulfotransferase NodH